MTTAQPAVVGPSRDKYYWARSRFEHDQSIKTHALIAWTASTRNTGANKVAHEMVWTSCKHFLDTSLGLPEEGKMDFTALLPRQRAGYLTSSISDSRRDHANTINGKWRSLVQRCECVDRGIEDGEEGRAAMVESVKKTSEGLRDQGKGNVHFK